MQTHAAKRVEILIEAPLERRLTDAIESAGVTGYTVLPVLGGSGRSGRWSREGQIGRSGMVAVVTIVASDRLNTLLDSVFAVVDRQIGIVSIADVQIVRPQRF
jgi:nitrogen regulatory protein PII